MTHAREQIRKAFVTALDAIPNLTTFNGRIFPLHDAVLPAVTVFTREEAIDPEIGRLEGIQNRALATSVQLYVKADEYLDDAMDTLSESVEAAIFPSTEINNLVRCLDLISVEIEVSMDGENPMGTMTMIFSCRYLTNDGFPGVII